MKSLGPALFTLGLLFAALGWIVFRALRMTGGSLTYPLDDTYIHMSIARHLAEHGHWSVTGAGFTSSTSSPLWTLLLGTSFRLFGEWLLAPFVLAALFAVALVVALDRYLRARGVTPLPRFAILFAAVFATPLPTLTFIGMEHVLHLLLSLAIVHYASRVLAPAIARRRDRVLLIASCALSAAVRYESLFMVGMLGLILLARRRVGLAFACGAAAALPVALYGLWSRAQGWYLLPNSVLLKGAVPSGSPKMMLKGLLDRGLDQLWANPQLLVLLVAVLVILSLPRADAAGRGHRDALRIYAGMIILHLEFAVAGLFYRYEAYLVGLGVALIGAALFDERERLRAWLGPPRLARAAIALLLAIVIARPLGRRALRSIQEAPRASTNIYEQQIQMARFLDRYYRGQPVALNDIGAVTWLADIHLIDLAGLGSLEPARLRLTQRFSTGAIDTLTRREHAAVAILYPHWFKLYGGLPAGWTEVGQWKIARNVVCGADSVSIYAVSPAEITPLIGHLREFDGALPREVARSGAYTQAGKVAALR